MSIKQYLECGKIVNTHGVKGEVKVEPWCDSPEFLLNIKNIYIDSKSYAILSARVHKGMVIILLEGIPDINTAMRYKNKIIYINRDDVTLAPGSWFIQDIIGFNVIDVNGNEIGVLKDVLDMPAGDVYVVIGREEHLIPAVPEFLKKVDQENKRITVSLIEGM